MWPPWATTPTTRPAEPGAFGRSSPLRTWRAGRDARKWGHMQRLLPFVSGVLSLSIFSLASCGGEHFDRALIENTEAGADHQPTDAGAYLDGGGGRPDVRDTP